MTTHTTDPLTRLAAARPDADTLCDAFPAARQDAILDLISDPRVSSPSSALPAVHRTRHSLPDLHIGIGPDRSSPARDAVPADVPAEAVDPEQQQVAKPTS